MQRGTLTILDGTFEQAATIKSVAPQYAKYVINCIDASFKDGTARIYAKGGTFCFDPSNKPEASDVTYVPADYTVTENTETKTWTVNPKKTMTVEKPESGTSGTVNTTVSGMTIPENGSDITAGNSTLTIDAKVGDASVITANVTVGGEAMNTIKDSSYTDVTITTDVGTLTVSEKALATIVSNATSGETTVDVTLSIDKTDSDTNSATYELTAKDSVGNNMFKVSDGTIKVSVPAPTDVTENVHVYYLSSDGAEKVDAAIVEGNVVWEVNHFSTYYITADEQTVSVTADGTTTTYGELGAALSAAQASGAEDIVVNLLGNTSMTTKATISKNVTINGNSYIITGVKDNRDVYFEVTDGVFRVNNVTLKDFGGTAPTKSGVAVIKVPDTAAADTEIVTNNVNFENFCRSAYDIRSGSFEITSGMIDCANEVTGDSSTKLTKGILAGLGKNKVAGTVSGMTFTNSNSNYEDWNSSAIEVYQNADVSVVGGTISNSTNGVWVDNYYSSGVSSSIAVVSLENVNVNVTGDAIHVDGKPDESNPGNTRIDIHGGTISGDIVIDDGGENDAVSMINADIDGALDNSGGTMSAVNSKLSQTPTADVTLLDCVDADGKPIADQLQTDTVAVYNGKEYHDLTSALTAAGSNGGNVYLVADAALSNVIPANTVLDVRKDITLTIDADNLSTLITSQGKIRVNAGATLNVDGTKMIGDSDANINLTEGYMDISILDSALMLEFTGATAEIPANQRWTLQLAGSYPMNVVLDKDTTLTVTSTGVTDERDGFRVANDATLTNNGKIIVNGIMSISSKGKVDGTGTITVGANGALMVNKSDNSNSIGMLGNAVTNSGIFVWNGDAATNLTGAITLTSGSKVYSQADISGKLTNYTAMGSKTYNNVEYAYAWEYYVPSGGGGGGVPTYSISTPSSVDNGTISVNPKSAAKDAKVTITVKPDNGYVLDKLTVKDADGKIVELTKVSDTEYTFKMPASKVTISVAFAEETVEPTSPFADVALDAYYYDAVLWAVENSITNGMTDTTFGPNAAVSRAQMVTFLWRAAGSPNATGNNPFADVSTSDYYYDAVLWAVEKGITNGMNDTVFGPTQPVSRAQSVTFQWRAAGSPAASGDSFADVAADAYYADAVTWAVENEITNGMSDTSFGPDVTVSRAQAVTFLYRAAN